MNVQKTLPTPSGRPISNAKYSIQPQARACDIAAVPAGRRVVVSERAASASYVVKAAALLRLKLTIDVACSINVRSDAPIIPTGSKEMLAATSPRTVGRNWAQAQAI